MPKPKSDLALASTSDLADELASRFDHFAVVGIKNFDEDRYGHMRRVKGSAFFVAGLLLDWANMILASHRKRAAKQQRHRDSW